MGQSGTALAQVACLHGPSLAHLEMPDTRLVGRLFIG